MNVEVYDELDLLESRLKSAKSRESDAAKEVRRLEWKIGKLKSRRFIEANGVTAADVVLLKDMPWVGYYSKLAETLTAEQKRRRFVEWNGRLCFMSDVLSGNFQMTDGHVDDVPKGGE